MRPGRALVTILSALTFLPAAAAAQVADRAAIDRAIAAVYPSLVRISVVAIEHDEGREIKVEGSGSGTIITPDGYVVTNHHVAGRTRRIVCTLPNREEVPADLVGTDPLSDIAVLKLRPATPRTFPAAAFGRSSALTRGEPVLAMGSPLSVSQSVTLGVISNTELIMPRMFQTGVAIDGENVGTIVRWLGHDAAIFPGNSGGPLVNLAGEIIGVNEISFGLAGAIPSDLARPVVDALIARGQVRRSWLGIEAQPLVGAADRTGALVAWVADGSPAARAGIAAGDELLRINGAAVDARFPEQLPLVNQALLGLPVGEAAQVVIRQQGRERTVTVVPEERGAARLGRSEVRAWGIAVADISAIEARELGRASRDGARVINLRRGGPAAEAKPPLQPGDIIVGIDGQPVRSVRDLETHTATALGTKARAGLLVAFERGLERRLTVVDAGTHANDTGGLEAAKAWVPVSVQVLTPPLAERLALAGRTGVLVTRVIDPACGVQVGDVILAIDGEAVTATNAGDEEVFAAAIRRYRIGASVPLTIVRDGKESALPVTLVASPRPPREMTRFTDAVFEFTARDLTASDRDGRAVTMSVTGVLVENVSRGGWADLAQLRPGDVIVSVDGTAVTDVRALEAATTAAASRKPASVVMQVQRGVRTRFVELQPSW
ncbi:MAG: PDZ domain-containing protein [Acidobacteria bacterium]|nr:PDZ domain-containing protein [Acidobacteriota bacterium]